ncbi:unnamed protein product [Peniophora sp. CBMAI 1063]|nr:unnamed protein product [Peniophora sp. CBMAI 1063]
MADFIYLDSPIIVRSLPLHCVPSVLVTHPSIDRAKPVMPQVSSHPPPYSRDRQSYPPPLPADVDHRAWTFQRSFENAREIVRWSVLQTFKVWADNWALEGQVISRNELQQAYNQAPKELKQAVDWQLKWDRPVIMTCDQSHRWHEHVQFDAASPVVQKAVQLTVSAWTAYNGPARLDPPQRDHLASVYENADSSLKLALCFILEMGIPVGILMMRRIEERRASIYKMVADHRAQMAYWNEYGQAEGLW